MDTNADTVEIQPGMNVVSVDGDKVGKIISVGNGVIVVEKGFFFPSDYSIPMNTINSADDDNVYLNVNKDDALNMRWSDEANWSNEDRTTGRTADLVDYGNTNQPTAEAVNLTGAGAQGTTGTQRLNSDETLTIPVREEELTATKRAVDAGEVVINKDVVEEQRTLDVPITEERVRVTRRVVNRDDTGDTAAFEGGTIEVPVRSEQVDVQKRVRVGEEIEIAKEAVQKTQQVTGTVRREVVDVEDNTQANVIDDATGTTTGTTASSNKKPTR